MKQSPSRHITTWCLCGSILLFTSLLSCKKFLAEKPDATLAVPSSLTDLQLLLDNYGIMNASYPYSAELQSDNYYLTTADWQALTNTSQKAEYIWQKDDASVTEWSAAYRTVFYANTVLDALPTISYKTTEASRASRISGAALFYRAHALYALAVLYAPPYVASTAATLPGLPLRTSADFNGVSTRASLQSTWNAIRSGYEEATALLPVAESSPNRPTRPAAWAGLARTCLSMSDYAGAERAADSALALNSTLLDYNTLSAAAALPFTRFNAEVLFPSVSTAAPPLAPARAKIDSVLYSSYASNDLRKALFFKSNGNSTYAFKGSYDASNTGLVFTGLTTAECYLIKAECAARRGAVSTAMTALNTLLQKRWKAGTFTPFMASTPAEALTKVLAERRKELVMRGARWPDLRRLNTDPATAVTLQRIVNGQTYTLPPGDPRYTLLIPKKVIDLTGMPQNP